MEKKGQKLEIFSRVHTSINNRRNLKLVCSELGVQYARLGKKF